MSTSDQGSIADCWIAAVTSSGSFVVSRFLVLSKLKERNDVASHYRLVGVQREEILSEIAFSIIFEQKGCPLSHYYCTRARKLPSALPSQV